MRLKKIKLAGFKSFVDPTSIPFPGDMTAIVGPNGCGKSNVIDAVRWVLGESSAKNLRGDAMTDVIFNGSSARKAVGQCSVELVFDNSSGRIAGEYAKYNELSIKRVVTRDAVSTYYLNASKCRRRDVTDLFLGTGLGPRSYAIIEQGMISRLIESKPQELRVFIEEAAGISKYKERRRETENRIRHTQDNLERLEDVRSELGRQLDKLQRQAAAARRYKTLKTQERQLKAELAAIRWLKQDDQLQKLQQQQEQVKNDIEALTAKQRGDEAGIEKYRVAAQENKLALDTLQQSLFTVSAAISRLEQSAQHNQQRRQQIQQELSALEAQLARLDETRSQLAVQHEELSEKRLLLEPEYEMKQASCEQLDIAREEAEQALQQHERAFQQADQTYHQHKQQVHTHHSKVQTLLQMQMRTQQRIGELEQELREYTQDDFESRLRQLEAEKHELEMQVEGLTEAVLEAEIQVSEAQKHLADSNAALLEAKGELQRLKSQHAALETLQKASSPQQPQPEEAVALWEWLTPARGKAALIEHVLTLLGDAQVLQGCSLESGLASQPEFTPGFHYFTEAQFTDIKVPGSVAAFLDNPAVPAVFNCIGVAKDLTAARASLGNTSFDLFVTESGEWLAQDWLRMGKKDEQAGQLQRAQALAALAGDITGAETTVNALTEQVSQAEASLAQCQETLKQHQSRLSAEQNALQQRSHQIQWLGEQQQQQQQKQQRLHDELARQKDQFEEEAIELAMLNENLATLEEQLAEQAAEQEQLASKRQSLQQQVASQRAQYEQYTRVLHEQALQLQDLRNKQQSTAAQQQQLDNQSQDARRREEALSRELESLASPENEQKEQLQAYLADKEQLEEQKSERQHALEHAESMLAEAMQGQQGQLAMIAKRQQELDSLKIEAEGVRVRGAAILEQFNELDVTLKTILENLPADAEEKRTQSELEQTTAAISRLGAVNLAAVEEYDIQAERKAHLDAQFDDLNEALDTLQNAIRKIDRETRTRFSHTFEQVNDDLKQLFPKVFGGGSAYLALTDDDLLETGVTIMARPPGKKNSTIHLLSGGEKALTALSLVFAIFRLNPAPFCLLDEVDAPLDDANVGRFCKLVSEMSKSVQFIYITHNKIAMEMASHLTGVTMAEPGVSRMVAVDVDEAVSLVEA